MKPGEKYEDYYKMHRIVFKKRQRLLDMAYTTGEMADELGVTPKYIRDTMVRKMGAPYRCDKEGRLWLDGLKIREWIEKEFDPKKKSVKLESDEFYCVRCREKRKSDDYVMKHSKGTNYKQAVCPFCGARMNKIAGRYFYDQPSEL